MYMYLNMVYMYYISTWPVWAQTIKRGTIFEITNVFNENKYFELFFTLEMYNKTVHAHKNF